MILFDDIPTACLVGTSLIWSGNSQHNVAVYSGPAIVAHFIESGMTDEEEAREYISFNMEGGFFNAAQPIIMWPHDPEEILSEYED